MFEYIKGRVVNIFADKLVIESNSIGYKINSSVNTSSKLNIGEEVKIYTHLVVREDELSLYGFGSVEELTMFQLLLSVTKIGPRVASAILSTHTPIKLGSYILNRDIKLLCKAPGVGKKTAERIILELKDKVDKLDLMQEYEGYDDGADSLTSNEIDEVVEALLTLGYNKFEAEKAVLSIKNKNLKTEDILKSALKSLGK